MNAFFFVFEKMSSSIPMFLVMLLAHVGFLFLLFFNKKAVLKNFEIFKVKNLCLSLFLIKLQDWRPTFLFKNAGIPTQVFFNEYCEIFKNSLFIEDLLIRPFRNFCLVIGNWYLRVIFYYCKIKPRNRKNFAKDGSKLAFRYLIISPLQIFVTSSNCKES